MKFSTRLSWWRMRAEPMLIDLDRVLECLKSVEDRRDGRGRRYPLWLLLIVALLAKLAGVDDVQSLSEWAEQRQQELCALFGFARCTMPVATTWARVFAGAVDVEGLNDVLARLLGPAPESVPRRGQLCVALDGKTLRGTLTAGSLGTHLLALYIPSAGIVLAQVEIGSKANEISAAPRVLKAVDLRGMVVTGDAMFAQRELSLTIVAAGGDYLWSVKDNQPHLKEAIAVAFTPQSRLPGWGQAETDYDTAQTGPEKGHGRIETRRLTASSMLQGYSDWPHLAQVFKLETTSTNLSTGKCTTTVRYGVTSLPHEVADAHRLLQLVREHWGIESQLHYVRDVVFNEDRCHSRMGDAAQVNATLNNLALALFRRWKSPCIASARRHAAYSIDSLLAQARRP